MAAATPRPAPTADVTPPRPKRRPTVRRHHDDEVNDPYAWLRDVDDPDVVAHLHAENAYTEATAAGLEPLRETIYTEISSRVLQTDLSVPVAYRGWWYYSRTQEGHQYPAQCRVPVVAGGARPRLEPGEAPPGEEVLLDGDVEARGGAFFSLGGLEVSNGGSVVAFAVDRSGDERFDVCVREVATGRVLDEALTGVGYGLVWSTDDRYLFYTRVDDAWRPHEVWRHEVGAPADTDVLLYREEDERFWMGIATSRDEAFLVLSLGSKTTSESHLLPLSDPTGSLRCVAPRREGIEYDVEPAGDILLVTHNRDRVDFGVSWAPLDGAGAGDSSTWQPWLDLADDERVVGVEAFAGHVVVSLRRAGLTALRVVPRPVGSGGERGRPWDLPVDEELYTIATGSNPEWETGALQVVHESFVTPRTILEVDLATRAATVLKRQPVLGDFDPTHYAQHRLWAQASDGARVPVSVVTRAGVVPDGSAPGLLYAYGAYEIPMDPYFSVARLSLLDRGVVHAVAHVRGGGEMGRRWYEQGRLQHKTTTFTDVVACADALVDAGWVDPARLALEGGSAGGLLVGAVLNLAPERFRVAHAAVPFVDALTTILDPTQPLTVTEWEEWGDPLHDPDVYALLKAYSPYENVRAVPYPAILATSSLNDTRVGVGEPAKWVARLRETVTSDQRERPILLRTEMVAGHGGRSGRYDAWRDAAWELAFLLHHLGADA